MERYRLKFARTSFLRALPGGFPSLPPMSSDPAVAAPAAQVPLRHAREVYRCTMFGTSQAWDIPDVLQGVGRNDRPFKKWYTAQRRMTLKSLAASGNAEAAKSIKETKEWNRQYMKMCRDQQRVMAQQMALWENRGPKGAVAALMEHEENLD